ncbi:hypothetical protein BDW59DRAFT_157858 [Aspergillus cavernicola]|uniref:Uncharacterized protein n=1 Tax=Aspergillus cavernicola TaxID=176166 RepID=A0ABR4IUI7_9EURO
MVGLAQTLRDLHFSKIHPLMPLPLFLVAEFLYDNSSGDSTLILHLQGLANIFRHLKNANNLQ